MVNTNKEEQFLNIFKNCIKIDAKTISVKTLLSERNLKRINYSPYYQRNYVWENVKQSFFIESVILGTEIPPLIFFKSGLNLEVIDGRQRFETLKRFKENDIKLNSKGLMSLEFLEKMSFNNLDPISLQDVFWGSNIRIFEFEVINVPNLDSDIEDKIKKEIFRRYNTGITSLTASEVDNARYNEDILSDLFKKELRDNFEFRQKVSDCFYNSDIVKQEIEEMTNYLRRIFILDKFPISKYASGKDRTETLDLLYDFARQNIEDFQTAFEILKLQIDKTHLLYTYFVSRDSKLKNKLIYECIFWAIRTIENDDTILMVDEIQSNLYSHYSNNLNIYSAEGSHYYGSIIARFTDTAEIFGVLTNFDFNIYIRRPNFSQDVKTTKEKKDSSSKISEFEHLRINKPSPISTPIDEIKTDIKSSRYLIRPPYQRQEKISEYKASSIIESILLGINLPPIFVFNRIDNTKEVIDGQQRLLSIIGFLGENYNNENGKLVFSKNNNFKLKGLKILTNLNRSSYSQLSEDYKDKILDFTIDVIMIEQRINPNFEPTDLFIRLNQKPYPINQNSFEMWNATVDGDVIKEIKRITKEYSNWFFIRDIETKRNDRMENEEFITILAYIKYNSIKESFDKIIGFFTRQNSITCRLTYKTGLTDFLQKLEKEAFEKSQFIKSIHETEIFIRKLKDLGSFSDKEDLNNYLNVRNKKVFRRSKQDFYIIWIVLSSYEDFSSITKATFDNIRGLISKFRNIETEEIENFVPAFVKELKDFYPQKQN